MIVNINSAFYQFTINSIHDDGGDGGGDGDGDDGGDDDDDDVFFHSLT